LSATSPAITRGSNLRRRSNGPANAFSIVDTGGIIPDDDAVIPANIFKQAGFAIDDAQAIIWVVDARQGLTPLDEELAKLLRGDRANAFWSQRTNRKKGAKWRAEAGEFLPFWVLKEVFSGVGRAGNWTW